MVVGRRDGLIAACIQRGTEAADAGRRAGAAGRQDRVGVGVEEVHRPRVTRRRVVAGVQGGDRETEGSHSRRGAGVAYREVRGRAWRHCDRSGRCKAAVAFVRGGDRLHLGGGQCHGKGARAAGQRAVGRQSGRRIAAGDLDDAGVAQGGVAIGVLAVTVTLIGVPDTIGVGAPLRTYCVATPGVTATDAVANRLLFDLSVAG